MVTQPDGTTGADMKDLNSAKRFGPYVPRASEELCKTAIRSVCVQKIVLVIIMAAIIYFCVCTFLRFILEPISHDTKTFNNSVGHGSMS